MDGAYTSRGYASNAGRDKKAEVIRNTLKKAGRPMTTEHILLDIGTGSGLIAANLSQSTAVITCDVVDQRTTSTEANFVRCNLPLPFPDNFFDFVVSNHVIEHVSEPEIHLQEIHRVLRPDGVAYLATPNRLWPYEFHTGFWLAHYMRPTLLQKLAQWRSKPDEPLLLQTTSSLKCSCRDLFDIDWQHQRMAINPEQYGLSLAPWARNLMRWTPTFLAKISRPLHPTLICLLHPR